MELNADMEHPPKLTRAQRLDKARDDFLKWAETADTDDVPGEYPDAAPAAPPAT